MPAGSIKRVDIVAAALALLDSGGLSALAMRRIAAELGVQQSALYWHFESKQELLAGVADQIVEQVAPPDGTEWRARVTELALNLRAELLDHKDGAELVATSFAFRLGADQLFSGFVDELIHAGVTREEADTGASVLLHFVLGYTTNEQQHLQAADLGAIDPEGDAGDSARQFTTDRFVRGIEVILAGIRSRLARGCHT